MNAVLKQRDWTPEQRLEQSRKLRERQIWLKSTGPRTALGKSISSRNARKPDYEMRREERAELRAMRAYLRTQKSYTDLLKIYTKHYDRQGVAWHAAMEDALFFLENELIDLERDMLGGKTFSELVYRNVIPFPPPLSSEFH